MTQQPIHSIEIPVNNSLDAIMLAQEFVFKAKQALFAAKALKKIKPIPSWHSEYLEAMSRAALYRKAAANAFSAHSLLCEVR